MENCENLDKLSPLVAMLTDQIYLAIFAEGHLYNDCFSASGSLYKFTREKWSQLPGLHVSLQIKYILAIFAEGHLYNDRSIMHFRFLI